ncbi:MAG: UDP-N-acetylmuramoyl-L-alanyl-D-glutamate--2,6-diaminopimelate ligase [Alphaproteobacteria bacterium]|nr:UDP-N-acetylmuramoyl-L-alanyl-D-glutamate--2,6-diaminopimelate ligase [Alphaproteobacteria bacterium]
MKISELAIGCAISGEDKDITGISQNSKTISPHFLFAALKGDKVDGRDFIDSAVSAGATAVLAQTGSLLPKTVTAVTHDEPRLALAKIAAKFYRVQPKTIAAVTGTSGKTSTVQFTRQLWQMLGHKSASVGTLGIIGDGIERYGSLTTPDSISLHQDLAMLALDKRITHLAMEASSHGLEQYRLDGVNVGYAAFTNLSRDHLDYHKTMENYLNAKLRLFKELLPTNGTAVVNADMAESAEVAAAVKQRGIKLMTYGSAASDVQLVKRNFNAHGQDLELNVAGKKFSTHINLVGAFQTANVLCALSLAIASGEHPAKVIECLPKLQPVRGRMEWVGAHKGGAVYVDYAHKPDALEQVLQALRPHTQNRLICVFGCGGNRDAGKRPIMGGIAKTFADVVIVTDDNPRNEDAASIRKAVLEGAIGATEIGNRADAIAGALNMMNAGDVVVIAGKGHEQGQIIGTQTLPFDDVAVAKNIMNGKAA